MTNSGPVSIRRATSEDSSDLFRWRNDPATREASLNQEPVGWEEHERWYASALASADRRIYLAIGELDGATVALGMCRFDRESDGDYEVSINLDPRARGRGLARGILEASIESLRREVGPVGLRATIRDVNLPSARTFLAAGFALERSVDGIGYYSASAGQPAG